MRTLRALVIIVLCASVANATCVWKDNAQSGDDNLEVLIAPQALVVAGVACHCDGLCTAPLPQIALFDRVGNSIATTLSEGPITCSVGTADSVWFTTSVGDPDRNLIEGEGLKWSITNAPGSFNRVTVCVR